MHKPSPSIENLILRVEWNEFDAFSKLIEVLSGRRGSADTVVNVATVEFRFGAVVLIEKLVFNVAYEKISAAGSHFSTHGHAFIFLR